MEVHCFAHGTQCTLATNDFFLFIFPANDISSCRPRIVIFPEFHFSTERNSPQQLSTRTTTAKCTFSFRFRRFRGTSATLKNSAPRGKVGLDLIGGTHSQCSNGGTDRGTKHPSIRSVGGRMRIRLLDPQPFMSCTAHN